MWQGRGGDRGSEVEDRNGRGTLRRDLLTIENQELEAPATPRSILTTDFTECTENKPQAILTTDFTDEYRILYTNL